MDDHIIVTVRTQEGSNQFEHSIAFSHRDLDAMVYPAGAVVSRFFQAFNECRTAVGQVEVHL